MTILAFDHLTTEERLTLIGELWDSIDADAIPLTDAQKAELDRRIARLDSGLEETRPIEEVLAELESRYR